MPGYRNLAECLGAKMTNWANNFLEQNDLSRFPCMPIRNGLVFSKPGIQTAVLQIQPVHYYESGEFKAIDTRLKVGQSGSYGAPGLSACLLQTGEVNLTGGYHHLTRGAGILNPLNEQYSEVVNFPNGAVSRNKIIREQGLFSHEIILSEKGLKEQLILQQLPNNLSQGYFVLETEILNEDFPRGKLPQGLNFNGVILNAGAAWDDNGALIEVSQFAVQGIGKKSILYSGVPVHWLENAVFPVVIDPTFTSQPGASGKDTYISEPNPTGNFGSVYKMFIGSNGSVPGYDFAALMQFDLSSLQPCSVSNATLTVTTQGDTATSSLEVTLQRILANWLENEASWNNRLTGSAWNSPGCLGSSDREIAALGTVTYYPTDPHNVSKDVPLNTTKVEEWINGTFDNRGFRFGYDGDITTNTFYAIYSSDEATTSYRPKLEIEYSAISRNFSVPAMLIG